MTYVRRALRSEIEPIVALARRFHAESPIHARLSFHAGKVENLVRVALDDPDWLPLVAVGDGLIGLGLFFCLPEFYSEDRVAGDFVLYVAPEQRGTRAAAQLLTAALEWAEAQGARAFNLGVHTGINHEATVRFFRRRGLEVTGAMLSADLPRRSVR